MPGGSTRRSYDRIAAAYRDQYHDELDKKPFDRDFLDLVQSAAGKDGWFIDLGSGPGQIGTYLASRGLRALYVDISFEMLSWAGTSRVQADMRALPFRSGSVAGIAAFYSLIHIAVGGACSNQPSAIRTIPTSKSKPAGRTYLPKGRSEAQRLC